MPGMDAPLSASGSATTRERPEATCQALSVLSLMAAPPVDQRRAAARINSSKWGGVSGAVR
jgi:hypothetical protein